MACRKKAQLLQVLYGIRSERLLNGQVMGRFLLKPAMAAAWAGGCTAVWPGDSNQAAPTGQTA